MSLDIGQILGGQYLVERVIGQGSMGLVYQGRDTTSAQAVAIRLILPEFDNEQVPAFVENDAKAVGQLEDEHIARLFNMGFLPSGERCIVSEYVGGEMLQRRMRRLGCMSELTVAQLLIQLLESLATAHEAGVVHRDLTPLSVFVVPRKAGVGDTVKLIDFGISRLQLLTADPDAPPASIVAEIESFQYLSPEQLNGLRELDPRSNIYTLGVIAYQAITGKLPFEGKDFGDLTFNILQGTPRPVEALAPESSSPFAQLIAKAMARSPNARFQYAEEMYAAISNWAIRTGVSKLMLESGITEWRNHDLEVPLSRERASVPAPPLQASSAEDEDEERTAVVSEVSKGIADVTKDQRVEKSELPASDNETLPWGTSGLVSPSMAQAPSSSRASWERVQASSDAGPEQSDFGAASAVPANLDPFQQPAPVGLAEEDALFAPPPTAPRDELPFVRLDDLATNPSTSAGPLPAVEPVAAQSSSAASAESPIQPVLVRDPAIAPPPTTSAEFVAPTTSPAPLQVSSAPVEVLPVPVEVSQAPLEVLPAPTAVFAATTQDARSQQEESQEVAPTADASVRQNRTILGIGGGVVQAPLSNEPGIQPSQAATDIDSSPSRPRLFTEPGINPIPAANGPAASASVVPSAKPTPAASSQASPVVHPRIVVQAAPAMKQAAGAQRGAVAAAAPAIEDFVASDTARLRSRRPLIIAIVLVGLAVAGVALAILQNKPESRKIIASEPIPSVPVAVSSAPSASVVPVVSAAPAPEAKVVESKPDAAIKELPSTDKKPAPTLSQSIASTVNGPRPVASNQTKPQKPARPTQSAQSSGASTPTKPSYSKPAAGNDPYKYR